MPKLLKSPTVECSYCGEDICDQWENGLWPMQVEGEDVCEECWTDKCQFTCSMCEEYGMVEDMHRFLLVADSEEADVPQGIYAITRKPYFVDYMIGGYLLPNSLSRIMDLPRHHDTGGYACGHLCANCQVRLGLIWEGKIYYA